MAAKTNFMFFALPRELRDLVYDELLPKQRVETIGDLDMALIVRDPPKPINLLLVNSQFSKELTQLWYEQAVLQLNINENATCPCFGIDQSCCLGEEERPKATYEQHTHISKQRLFRYHNYIFRFYFPSTWNCFEEAHEETPLPSVIDNTLWELAQRADIKSLALIFHLAQPRNKDEAHIMTGIVKQLIRPFQGPTSIKSWVGVDIREVYDDSAPGFSSNSPYRVRRAKDAFFSELLEYTSSKDVATSLRNVSVLQLSRL